MSAMLRMTPEAVKAHQERIARQLGRSAVRTVIADKPKPKTQRSALEVEFQRQIAEAGLPAPEFDVPYLVGSRHRLDVCYRAKRLGVEVQGGVHRIKGRFKADLTKRAEGLLQGWAILEVGRDEIESGKAIQWLKSLLNR